MNVDAEQELPRGSPVPASIWLILMMALIDMMSMGIVMPVIPMLIEELTGSAEATGIWTGIIASLWAVIQFGSAPVVGALSDRFGRRPVLLISAAGLSISWAIMGLAPTLAWLVIGRVIGSITSASGPAIFAYMADIVPPEGRTRAFGMVGAAISAGFVFGPALGGFLGEWSPRLPFYVAAALSAGTFLYGLLILPESLAVERRRPFSWKSANPAGALKLLASHGDLARLSGSYFLLSFAHRIYTTVFVLYAAHRYGLGMMEVGLLLAFSGGLDLILQGYLAGRLAGRFGDRPILVFGLIGGAVGLACMAVAPTAALFIAGLVVNSVWGLAEPAVRSLTSSRVPEDEQGQLQGAMQCVLSLAGMTGPLFFGWIYAMSYERMPSLTFLAGTLIVAVAALLAAGERRPRSAGLQVGN